MSAQFTEKLELVEKCIFFIRDYCRLMKKEDPKCESCNYYQPMKVLVYV